HTRFSRDWSSDVCSSDLINEKLFVDLFYYYNRFLTFEGSAVLVQKKNPEGPMSDLADPTKRNVYSMPLNAEQTIKNSGWGIGAEIGRASCRERVERSEGV